jgi:putative transcriptional regulator
MIQLKEVRNSRGMTQAQLAAAIGMTLGGLQKIEYSSVKSIPLKTLQSLCQVLHCQPGDLLIYQPENEKAVV